MKKMKLGIIEQYNINFGLKREEVRDILGEPSSIDKIKVSDLTVYA
jgi:hypothetical protein